MKLYETLAERGYIAQVTHEEEVRHILNEEKIHFYIGFDATADSLHVGHFLTMMVMSHMQNHGHIPIALLGGGTTMVGDPSGRTDMRQMMTPETINHNAHIFKEQMHRFISFENNKAIMANNADWLTKLNYVQFLREYGANFSVNRMLTADAYKNRMEQGLTFLEFNYMIMQAYDFLELNNIFGCTLQIGGRDQWSNIIAGVDLIRRKKGKEAYGLTLNLLETSTGEKMGKTAKGALWLSANKTTPYEFYQYFRNIDDTSVINCLKLLTFVEMSVINEMAKLKGQDINNAKTLLAYEVTKLVHGEEEAEKARTTAQSLFENNDQAGETIPTYNLPKNKIGIDIVSLLIEANLAKSKTEARRLLSQNGIKINGEIVTEENFTITESLMIQKGKKTFCKIYL
ncbi:MAG: tyrosine--tRNA ligase [Defluviitaleaceae bacterium]|nr:tyrosine--tRNA ligase [Defluviitaleaceae bacterium]